MHDLAGLVGIASRVARLRKFQIDACTWAQMALVHMQYRWLGINNTRYKVTNLECMTGLRTGGGVKRSKRSKIMIVLHLLSSHGELGIEHSSR